MGDRIGTGGEVVFLGGSGGGRGGAGSSGEGGDFGKGGAGSSGGGGICVDSSLKQTHLSAALSSGFGVSAGPKMLSRSAMECLFVFAVGKSSAFTSASVTCQDMIIAFKH